MQDNTEHSQGALGDLEAPGPSKSMGRLKSYRRINRLFGVLYIALAVAIFWFPVELFYLINVGPKVFRITDAIPDSTESFWRVFATASYATLAAICFLAAETPRIRGYSMLHLLSKVVAAACFLWLVSKQQRIFAYILGASVELCIFAIISWVTFRVPPEK